MKRLIAATLALYAGVANADEEGRRWVAALSDPGLRDEAACRLILRNEHVDVPDRYHEHVPSHGCLVTGVVDNTARPDGAVLVFLDSRYTDDRLKDGSPGGYFMLFDREGADVEEFTRANSLHDPGGVIVYRKDGDVAVVQQGINGGFKNWKLGDLYVVPATVAQSPILAVIMGNHTDASGKARGPEWGWRAQDLDQDGTMEIEIGPVIGNSIKSKAVYRYSLETHRYEGPPGSLAGDFYTVSAGEDSWRASRDFVRAHDADACDLCAKTEVPVGPSRKELFEQFTDARLSRNYELADSLIPKVVAHQGIDSSQMDAVASYWVFDRGRCNADFLPVEKQKNGYIEYSGIPDAVAFCEAAKLSAEAKDELRTRMAALIDGRVGPRRHLELYDEYARQSTINARALELLSRFHLGATGFKRDGDSALIEQIRAGRADNVALLLDHGYDANVGVSRMWDRADNYEANAPKPFLPLPVLPLQAVVDSLPILGDRALEIAKVLLDHGANPSRLKWYPRYAKPGVAEAGRQARMDRLLEEGAAGKESISAEFFGLLVEYTDSDSRSMYARFLVGNGSDQRVSIPAWKIGDDYLLNGLNSASHFEHRLEGGTKWQSPIIIEHGWSPATRLEIEPGESREVWATISEWELATEREGVLTRLWISNGPGAIHSEPFELRAAGIESRHIGAERDWLGMKQEASRQ